MKKIMLAGFVAMCAGFSVAATPLLQLDFNTENGAASLLDCASGMKWDGTTAAVIVESTPVSQSGCVGSVKNNDAKKQYFQTKRFFAGFFVSALKSAAGRGFFLRGLIGPEMRTMKIRYKAARILAVAAVYIQ